VEWLKQQLLPSKCEALKFNQLQTKNIQGKFRVIVTSLMQCNNYLPSFTLSQVFISNLDMIYSIPKESMPFYVRDLSIAGYSIQDGEVKWKWRIMDPSPQWKTKDNCKHTT
jgi:hypothetical protein